MTCSSYSLCGTQKPFKLHAAHVVQLALKVQNRCTSGHAGLRALFTVNKLLNYMSAAISSKHSRSNGRDSTLICLLCKLLVP